MVQCYPLMTTRGEILQQIVVPFEYPVCFTRGVFRPENSTLVEVLNRKGENRRHRVFVAVDGGLARARPSLLEEIESYAAAHADRLELVQSPRLIPGGEAAKNDLMGVAGLINALVERRLCRHSYVIAVGGGAVLDAVGFAAALVHRGLRHVRIPTTVLAQCDSGVGVKNAINLNGVKNLVGTFSPPFAVVNDSDFLDSLNDRAWIDGIAEAFKVAIIKDRPFFEWLLRRAADLRARDRNAMEYLIRRCAELHLEHIRSHGDPFEFGTARPLDFGHWSAHKLEAMTNYRVSHGQAVALGVALDSAYAALSGWLTEEEFQAVYDGLSRVGFALWHEGLERMTNGRLAILQGLEEFREHLGGELALTMPRGLGMAQQIGELQPDRLVVAIEWLKRRAEKKIV